MVRVRRWAVGLMVMWTSSLVAVAMAWRPLWGVQPAGA